MAFDGLYKEMIKRAIKLARNGEGNTSPNPMVGAVIFNSGGIISTGYHKKAGAPHAEINALKKAGEKARGASIAISLEPCCHFGKTGPCAQALIDAGIKKVIYAVDDPFHHNGHGRRFLSERGIKVISGICENEAQKLNEVYFHFIATGHPFVVLKLAQTLDGRIASSTGDSKWITGASARAFAHKLRARYDAIAVGSNTVIKDNPSLTVRHVKGNNPFRIILTTSDNIPKKHNLFSRNSDDKTIVATTRKVKNSKYYASVRQLAVRKSKYGLDLKDMLKRAGKEGITSILFEGGAQIATALLKMGLVNKYYQFTAPIIIGEGINGIGNLGISRITGGIHFKPSGYRKIGSDRMFWGYPE